MKNPLSNEPTWTAFQEGLQRGASFVMEELWNAPKAYLAAEVQRITRKHLLILTAKSQEESKLHHDLTFFAKESPFHFPQWETLPGEETPPSADVIGERFTLLKQLLHEENPKIVLTSVQAALQHLVPPSHFEKFFLPLSVGDEYPFTSVLEQLAEMGYQRRSIAADKGEFAVRGGIIDLFPVSLPEPVRIEFWGDRIESIRAYDPISQRSIRPLERVEITLGEEKRGLEQDKTTNLLDYLGENTLLIFDDLLAIDHQYTDLLSLIGSKQVPFLSFQDFLERAKNLQTLFWANQPLNELSPIKIIDRQGGYYSEHAPPSLVQFEAFGKAFQAKKWNHPFQPVIPYLLPEWNDPPPPSFEKISRKIASLSGHQITFLLASEAEKRHFIAQWDNVPSALPENAHLQMGYLSSGFVLPSLKEIVFPLTELTRRYKIRRQKLRNTYHATPIEVFDLTPGEMVVHMKNGIGKYQGIKKRLDHNGIEREFFSIEYAGGSRLFVPFNQAHLLSKYIGANETLPKLHTLGSTNWQRALVRTEAAVDRYAKELIEIYAKRKLAGGFSYPPDGEDVSFFEEEFPFTETEDQLSAIRKVKEDMQNTESMDRLVCGDVGYGKTEVAMRAAFKAVVDGGKQVAVLVPTTVLAMQHFEHFVERMQNFPVRLTVLSRFRTNKQIQESLGGIEQGSIDIAIGTHRIISKDVRFKDLGLVIIDEEQRFGVKSKEHLKKIRSGVDCLTLSATPIPRTLHMSLVGARDLSLINTPPQERLPIHTTIASPSDEVMKNALLRELARDGQAYVIHNRVESIWSMADRVKKMLPQARVQVAHGQMNAKEIDATFHAFKMGQIDILVTTSIVENGVDIPNANTILIDRADRFGLADLYQLRGRVGRWNRQAYAYFFIPNFHALPEITRKRIAALAESSGYGGGMKLAMRDLEIRGAGNILGTKQSGHIAAVGFDLYCKMLKRKVGEIEGKGEPLQTEIKVDLPFDARVPESYIKESQLRLEVYYKLGEALSINEVDAIYEELKDRFGPPPKEVLWLYRETRLKVAAQTKGFTLLALRNSTLKLTYQRGKECVHTSHQVGTFSSPEAMEKEILLLFENLVSRFAR